MRIVRRFAPFFKKALSDAKKYLHSAATGLYYGFQLARIAEHAEAPFGGRETFPEQKSLDIPRVGAFFTRRMRHQFETRCSKETSRGRLT